MKFKKYIILITLILLTGCSFNKIMDASYLSKTDPDFSFMTNTVISVHASENKNEIETKHYINNVVNALKKRGFTRVYSYRDFGETYIPVEIYIIINISKKSKSYEYEGANYGMVDSGNSTVNCTGFVNMINCTENKQKSFGVTGYSTKTGISTGYYFSGNWFKVKNKEKVMFTFASSFEKGCSDRAMFEFLIEQTISRLDFTKPKDYEYSVEMPEKYSCNY